MPSPLARRLLAPLLPLALAVPLLASVAPAGAAPDPGPTLVRQDETGKVGFIGAPAGHAIDVGLADGTSAATVATTFLRQNATALGLTGKQTTVRVAGQHRSATGGRSVRVRQEYAGIPVFGGEFTVNLDADQDVLSVLGEASPIGAGVATRPRVGAGAAAEAAVAKVARAEGVSPGSLVAADPELMFYDPRLLGAPGPFQTARLSWVTEVRGQDPAIAHTAVVDATKGVVALSFSTIAHARDRVVCDADNTALQYPCTSPVWTESSQPAGVDADVAAAFEYAGDTYDFFKDEFDRDSLDGAGMQLVSTADYCDPTRACPYQNAFWDGEQMVYGDGFAVADDVVGHELSHGVTDFSSSLFYYMQSGAINESMSDIFGELIDLGNGSGTDTPAVRWLLGEDIPGIGAIRDMENPPAFDQPDRMNSPQYFSGEDDSGGVHYNSGVSNKAAFLLTDGGTFNGHTVTALGATKTGLLFYTVNNDLLVSGSDFADLANGLRQACTSLSGSGTGGITAADCAQVEEALLATEMDLNPNAAPTDEVEQCLTGVPSYTYQDDLETDSGQFTVQTIFGAEVWSYPQNPNDYLGYDATYATSGETNIWGDDIQTVSDSALRMTDAVTIPAGAYLHFNHAYGFDDDAGDFYDGGVVEYSTNGGGAWTDAGPLFTGNGAGGYDGVLESAYANPLGGRSAFVGESNGYGASRADLSTLAGQDVMFRWRIGTDFSLADYGWNIDDVSIYTCVVDVTPPDTMINSGPANGSTITTNAASFGFDATEGGSTFECDLDGAGYAACTSPKTFTGLGNGPHTFSVRATDGAGNTDASAATRTFTVAVPAPDRTAPQTTITKKPKKSTALRKARFAFKSSEPGSRFRCKVDAKPWKPCTSPFTVTVKPGKHTFSVAAIDRAGNVDKTAAVWRWTVKRR